ncbi:MAG TPA: hypothetical protein VMD91_10370 [Candidatus Sulfotelmatobacter sp.]|nr:hypothetical protein [Candidatus Sulfotelmatobacter sp.]
MTAPTMETEVHEHPGPQCDATNQGAICKEASCRHDHHVSRHMEVTCTPVHGRPDYFSCAHKKQSV